MGQCCSTPAIKEGLPPALNVPQHPLPPSSPPGRWEWVPENAPPLSRQHRATQTPQQDMGGAQMPTDLSSFITNQNLTDMARVGRSGFAHVFRLNHKSLGAVALKRIIEPGDEEGLGSARRHGKREAATWNQLHHENILNLLGTYESPTWFFLVSPFCSNGNISDFAKKYPQADRLTLLVEAAEGVDYIHRSGFVHGGIKASSILVSDTFHALVVDFGMSRLQQDATPTSLEDVAPLRWKSPEFLIGGSKTPASDIWAFGMTIYEVLSGHKPFHTIHSDTDVVRALIAGQFLPDPTPATSATGESYSAAWGFASSCWNKKASARPSLGLARTRFGPVPPTYFLLKARQTASLPAGPSTQPVRFYPDELSRARKIGAGGFGDVFLVTKEGLGQVAMKRLRESGDEHALRESRRRAGREAQLWLELDHPNLLPLFGHLETRDAFYFASPYMRNGALVGFIARNPSIDRRRLIAEAAAGVAHLHNQGVIHGDIKAGNVLVDDEEHARVHDFSLSRLAESQTSMAARGDGTLRWQSPELIRRGHGKTTKSDVWAFGMLIYEVLSGQIPFKGTADVVVMRAMDQGIITPEPQPETSPTGVPYAAIWAIAKKCWHENPAQRPTMGEIHDQLVALLLH